MACCSEINKNKNRSSQNNILDYVFKAGFVIVFLPVMFILFFLKYVFSPANVLFSILVYFSRVFLRDINEAILSLNSMRLNCRLSARLYAISPVFAGFAYRNFGYILFICFLIILLLGVNYLWPLILILSGKIFHR